MSEEDVQMDSMDLDLQIDNQEANALLYQVLAAGNGEWAVRHAEEEEEGNNIIENQEQQDDWLLQLQFSPMAGETAEDWGETFNYPPNIPAKNEQALQFAPNQLMPESAGYGLAAHQVLPATHDARLKDCHKMHLKAYYQHILIGANGRGIDIDHRDGFVVFHKRCYTPNVPDTVAPVSLPPLIAGDIEEGDSPTQKDKTLRFTTRVLCDMAKGLHVMYDNGKIYATRYCASRVFAWSPTLNKTQSTKLDREKTQEVFDYRAYFDRLDTMSKEDLFKETCPVIVFTFGQQWNKSSTDLKNIYVRVEVIPVMAVEKLENLNGGQWECKSIAKSIREDDFERSTVDGGSVVSF